MKTFNFTCSIEDKYIEMMKDVRDFDSYAAVEEKIGNNVIAFFAYAAAHNITEDDIWSYCFMVDTFDTGNYIDFLSYRFEEKN